MKHMLRLGLLLTATLLAAGCGTVQSMRDLSTSEDLKSSGTSKMDSSLSTLALSVNGNYEPDGGPDAPSGQVLADIRKFGGSLASRFPAEFPKQLEPYGVAIGTPGRGMPLLRLYIASGRGRCDERGICQAEARVDGSLIGSDGNRAWWFTYWVDADDEPGTYRDLYRHIVDAMAKDQVVTKD